MKNYTSHVLLRGITTVMLGVAIVFFSGCGEGGNDEKVIRMGHFPNITHVQALIARNMERKGKGWFEERVPGYRFEWFIYNAGPSAMEAVFARSIDMTYVGPSPAINAYAKSKGQEARIVAGAVNGASALVVQPDAPMANLGDFLGKTIATPQLGNTQDVSSRAWLAGLGCKVILRGALAPEKVKEERHFTTPGTGVDINLMPTANPDQLPLFRQKKLDAVWTVEPWVSVLEQDAEARILIEEKDAVTTVLVARSAWMKDHPRLLFQVVKAHRELTDWILQHPEEAREMVVDELSRLTKTPVSPKLVENAWKRLVLTNDISVSGLEQFIKNAQSAGLLDQVPPVSGLVAPPSATIDHK